ncbi:hypothetical protein PVAP13_2KG346204 [Panicum virgatum]|uniref:Uncharacterized protein n=1 Tax=Panicum virgatum TaxID=38727 RepID=A0A8T0W9T9_PANVG|nr:hypothetical protein PVAP13_2KG346204 [Panicum virgatum]
MKCGANVCGPIFANFSRGKNCNIRTANIDPGRATPPLGGGFLPFAFPSGSTPRSDFPQCPNPRRPKALRPAAPPRSDFPRPADQEGRRSLLDGRCPHPARRHRPLQEQTRYDAGDITAMSSAQDPTVRLLDVQGRLGSSVSHRLLYQGYCMLKHEEYSLSFFAFNSVIL